MLAKPPHRNPPNAPFCSALCRGGLAVEDYQRLGGALLFLVLSCLFGGLLAGKLSPGWAGITTGFCILVLALTWVTVRKYTNTLSTLSVLPTTLALVALVWAYCLYFWLDELGGEASNRSLALLFLAVVYPVLVLAYVALFKFADDGWALSRFVRNALAICCALLAAFVGVVFAVSVVAGFALLVSLCWSVSSGCPLWQPRSVRSCSRPAYSVGAASSDPWCFVLQFVLLMVIYGTFIFYQYKKNSTPCLLVSCFILPESLPSADFGLGP